ncbi:MAG: alpha/beta hydrolase [Bacteroidetes bacterium]|nr:alpha/beta hydrolase [Bacteroidota bacterium]
MERIIKLLGIAGLLAIAFSCFADNVQLEIKVAQVNGYNSIANIISGELEHNTIVDSIDRDKKVVDLIIKTNDIQIGGTLTLPSNFETSSLVIMSSGSGNQDRDETLEGFKIFKLIAEHLASKGIASFRYDDRGVGTSTGDFVNSTIENLSDDVEIIMDYFKSKEKYSFNDFILFGHSQGGIIAAKVAVGNESVKKVILMGAPAVPLVEVVLYQVRQEYNPSVVPKSLIEANVSAHNKLMRAIEDNNKMNDALKVFQESTKSILYELSSSDEVDTSQIEQEAIAKTKEFEIIYALPSLTSFLYYDPSSDYEQLEVPVLGLFGGLDFQVTIDQNKDRMENALLKSGTDYHFVTFEDANHFFQKATTGSRDEYGTLEKKFVDNFLDEISNWIIGN